MLLKGHAAIGAKCGEICCQTDRRMRSEISGGKVFEQMAEYCRFSSRRCFPVNEGQAVELVWRLVQAGCSPRPGHAFVAQNRNRIRMERIVEQAIRRRIWTEMARLRGEQGVRRTQRNRLEPASGRCLRQRCDTRHIADATITSMPQGVNLRCH